MCLLWGKNWFVISQKTAVITSNLAKKEVYYMRSTYWRITYFSYFYCKAFTITQRPHFRNHLLHHMVLVPLRFVSFSVTDSRLLKIRKGFGPELTPKNIHTGFWHFTACHWNVTPSSLNITLMNTCMASAGSPRCSSQVLSREGWHYSLTRGFVKVRSCYWKVNIVNYRPLVFPWI
jgi:hypothetical protein